MCKKTNNINGLAGFSLIETIIYIAIITIFASSLTSFSILVSDARNKAYVVGEVQSNARIAMSTISKHVRGALDINTVSSTFNTDPGVLSIMSSSSSTDPTIFSLTADDGVLQIQQGAGAQLSVTSDEVRITNLVFTDLTGSSTQPNVGIELTVEFVSRESILYQYDFSLQTSISSRK